VWTARLAEHLPDAALFQGQHQVLQELCGSTFLESQFMLSTPNTLLWVAAGAHTHMTSLHIMCTTPGGIHNYLPTDTHVLLYILTACLPPWSTFHLLHILHGAIQQCTRSAVAQPQTATNTSALPS